MTQQQCRRLHSHRHVTTGDLELARITASVPVPIYFLSGFMVLRLQKQLSFGVLSKHIEYTTTLHRIHLAKFCYPNSRPYRLYSSKSRIFAQPSRATLSMNWSAHVLSTVTSDTEPTFVVTFDNAKYVFNVGENTTRAFIQSRHGWRKTRAVFLSQVSCQRSAGLPGTLQLYLTCIY